MPIRLLALDLDGTVLDPYGDLTDGVREAVGAARRRGLWVVLCTGRRFRTARPLARELGLSGPIVVNNGVLVKDLDTGETLDHRYLRAEVRARVLALIRPLGPPLVYVDGFDDRTDIITESHDRAHHYQREYFDDNREFCQIVEDATSISRHDVIMVSTMGDAERLATLRARGEQALAGRVRMHSLINKNYQGQILEFLSPESGKWAALQRLAARAGISPEEIAAVGDDSNDVEMIAGAGLGIAMGNAVAPARAAADRVVRSNAEGGAIEAIEGVVAAVEP
jgi:Cof subfamily protein (haloacid dehalogenase superfamily)